MSMMTDRKKLALNSIDDINAAFRAAKDKSEGYVLGVETDTVEQAIEHAGLRVIWNPGTTDAPVVCMDDEGEVIAVGDVWGPYAVNVTAVLYAPEDDYATDADVEQLRIDAGAAGDQVTVALCDQALDGDLSARAECAQLIRDMGVA